MKISHLVSASAPGFPILQEQVDLEQTIATFRGGPETLNQLFYAVWDEIAINPDLNLSGASELKLFMLFRPRTGEPLVSHTADPGLGPRKHSVNFTMAFAGFRLFLMASNHVFKKPAVVRNIRELAEKTMNEALPLVEKYIVRADRWKKSNSQYRITIVAEVAGMLPQLKHTVNTVVGEEYRRLERVGREINNISDPAEARQALANHSRELQDTLEKIMS